MLKVQLSQGLYHSFSVMPRCRTTFETIPLLRVSGTTDKPQQRLSAINDVHLQCVMVAQGLKFVQLVFGNGTYLF